MEPATGLELVTLSLRKLPAQQGGNLFDFPKDVSDAERAMMSPCRSKPSTRWSRATATRHDTNQSTYPSGVAVSCAQELRAAPNKQSTQNTKSLLRTITSLIIVFTGSDAEDFRFQDNEAARLPGGSTPTACSGSCGATRRRSFGTFPESIVN